MDSMFITLPTAMDVKTMLGNQRTPVHVWSSFVSWWITLNWCIYALFINGINKIKKNCVFKPVNRTTNLAYSLDGYLWAISALASEKLQIRCNGNTCSDNSPSPTNCRHWQWV